MKTNHTSPIGEPCSHDYVRSDNVCIECGVKPTKAELKACPFCGSDHIKKVGYDQSTPISIRCYSCYAETKSVESWNTRFEPAEQADNAPLTGDIHSRVHRALMAAHPNLAREFAEARAAASAHTIGEDAANVAIGEREAFEAFWENDDVSFPHHESDPIGSHMETAWEAWQARALLASKTAVPEGFKLVPASHGPNWIEAGFWKGTGARHVYAAMLAASPTALAQSKE